MKKLNWMLQLLMLLLVCWRVSGQGLGETFGTSLKGIQLPVGKQVLVFSRFCAASERPCLMQHWWSGGSFAQYAETTVRYFVDSEPALVMPLGLAHGMSNEFMDDDGPWSAGQLFGKTGKGLHGQGSGSGFFNSFQIPFAQHVNVTVEIPADLVSEEQLPFWLVLRGRTHAKLSLPGGMALPISARLRSYLSTVPLLAPAAHLQVVNTSMQHGAVMLIVLAVTSPRGHYQFLEGCMRAAHVGTSAPEYLLSSGTEDYFLGTFYFDAGQYFMPIAGVTSLCPPPNKGSRTVACNPAVSASVRFSAYRVHGSSDPLLFERPFSISWRNGEPGHGGAPPAYVNATAFALVYEWTGPPR